MKGTTMDYFDTLTDEQRKRAWQLLADDLVDSWLDSTRNDSGDELPDLCEEELLSRLGEEEGINHVSRAVSFYGKD